jgi:hypothetical protein
MAIPIRIEYRVAFYDVTAWGNQRKRTYLIKRWTSIANTEIGDISGRFE